MRIVSFISLTLSILVLMVSSSLAHPWTLSDLDIKEQGSPHCRGARSALAGAVAELARLG